MVMRKVSLLWLVRRSIVPGGEFSSGELSMVST